jgi:hypothetical protein
MARPIRAGDEVWLDGENAGKRVKDTPIKIKAGVAYKLDPEARLDRQQLKAMEDPGWLQTQAEYHSKLGSAFADFHAATIMAQENPRLVATQRPPSKWPLRLLLAAMLVMLATVLVLAWQVAKLARNPTLPSQGGETAILEPARASQVARGEQGRVERSSANVVAKRLQVQP